MLLVAFNLGKHLYALQFLLYEVPTRISAPSLLEGALQFVQKFLDVVLAPLCWPEKQWLFLSWACIVLQVQRGVCGEAQNVALWWACYLEWFKWQSWADAGRKVSEKCFRIKIQPWTLCWQKLTGFQPVSTIGCGWSLLWMLVGCPKTE